MAEPGYRGASLVEESEILGYLDKNLELFIDDKDVILKKERVYSDPFEQVAIKKQLRKVRRRAATLQKRFKGVEGAEAKFEDPEKVNGYGVFDVVIPPYDLEGLSALFDENPVLRAVVEARAMNTVGVGYTWEQTLKAQKRVARASGDQGKSERVRSDHQREVDKLEEVIEGWNEEETFTETLIKVWLDALALGTGYMEIGRTKSGKVGYIGHIPSRHMRIRKARDGFVQLTNSSKRAIFFRNYGDTETPDQIGDDPSPNEIISFKIYSPNSAYYGIPPSVSAVAAIAGDKFAKEYNIDFFENKAVPRYAIILKGVKLSAQSKKELIAYFKNELKGKNHGTLIIPLPAAIGNSEADIKFEALENKVQDASFENYRKANRDEIILAYRVPPTKVAILESANLAMARDADKTFKTQVIGPDQQIFEKKINRVVSEFSDLLTIKLKQIDIIDEDLESRINDRYLRTEVVTPNEIREKIGLPPIEGGDEVLPYPVKAQLEIKAEDAKLKAKAIKEGAKVQGTDQGGAPQGNTNGAVGSPPKSGQDNGSNSSDAVATGTNQSKGQRQDTVGVRERNR